MSSPVPSTFSEASECALCYSPSVIDPYGSDGPSLTTPDDLVSETRVQQVITSTGHAFKSWTKAEDGTGAYICPLSACNGNPLDVNGRLLVTVRNEGGVTNDFDLGKAFDEEKEESLACKQELAMLDAARSGDWEIVENLLSEGVNPNAIEDEETRVIALHVAAFPGDSGFETVQACLRYGADLNLLRLDGFSTLDAACRKGAFPLGANYRDLHVSCELPRPFMFPLTLGLLFGESSDMKVKEDMARGRPRAIILVRASLKQY